MSVSGQGLVELVKKNWVVKLSDIRDRMIAAVRQLSDEQVNWRPNEESNSIANLIVHIEGNIHQRIESTLLGGEDRRDRDSEFDNGVHAGAEELIRRLNQSFELLLHTASTVSEERLYELVPARDKQVTVYELLSQCATHFSEHLGQVLYLAKMQLGDRYITLSIPKKKS
ncbi:DinB family protein [Paenibacillus piri]|uniref:DUF1572 domain-containing protein n=1 Tax=Paenibacillus piri TaxID=2547395 RepID=A0A4R5KXC9_9BACL|nr:DinB family protein [Paenibacillus piri]TDF99650.1 DUF1572 domain-containing protein [Paenibacillus piri]